jgi:hypothetical protein
MTAGTLDAVPRRAIATKRWEMICRLLFGLALVFFAVPASAEESLLDVVLKRDRLIVATYSTSSPLAYVDWRSYSSRCADEFWREKERVD